MNDYDYSEQPKKKRGAGRKIFGTLFFLILLAAAGFFYFKFYFVFGEGVKAGELNRIVYKGYVFKTYEGLLIQAGYNNQSNTSGVQSNTFDFSVADKNVAKELETSAGKFVQVHYKEYKGTLPWRGMQKYVVDSVLSVTSLSEPEHTPVTVPTEIF
jgi:hypothetical protein